MPGERPARWGYHRLAEPSARRLVEAAGIRRGDLVLDIGAGDGVLTQLALEHGARVVAIEAHPGRARDLRSRFAGRGVKVVRADAADLRLPTRPFVVVANPPFGITTALLKRLLARNGQRVEEPFWRDTVLLHAKETVDVGLVPQDRGKWMLHCHILEHAESGMMTLVEVAD